MVLLADGFPIQLIFFILVAVISVLSKVFEKSQAARKEAIRKQQREQSQTRAVLPWMEEREEAGAPLLAGLPILDELPIVPAPLVQPPAAVRAPVAPAPPPPPPRTRMVRRKAPRVRRAVDEHYVIHKRAMHPVVARLRHGGRDALREAVLLHEILGPPKAYQHRHPGGVKR